MQLKLTILRDGRDVIFGDITVSMFDTIKHVKTVIYRQYGVDPEKQSFYQPGVVFEDNRTVDQCCMSAVERLVVKELKIPLPLVGICDLPEYGPFTVQIMARYNNVVISLLVEKSDTLQTMIEMISATMHIPPDMQRLSTSYRRQLKNDMTLEECGISRDEILLLDVGGPITINVFLIDKQKNVRLEVELLDTLDTVKSKIQDMEGMPASEQWFKVGSTDINLKGESTLAECEIGAEDTLYLQTTPMRVNVMFYPTNEIVCLKVEETDTINMVKDKIHLKIGVSSDKVWLSNLSQMLSVEWSFPGDRTLADCNICNGDTLLCDFKEIHVPFDTPYISTLLQLSVIMSTGENITMEANPSDTISYVKSEIEAKQGSLNQNVLFYKEKQLPDNHVLSHLPNRSVLYCLPKPRARLQILVKMVNGKTTVRKVKSTKIVRNLLKKIQDTEGMSHQQHKLLLAGKVLNNNSTILECGIRWNSLLHIVPE